MDQGTKSVFDGFADTYTNDFDKATIRRLIDLIGLKPGMNVLEAGCGNGDFTPFLLEDVGEGGAVCLLDISSEMIQKAREKLMPRFKNRRMLFFVADVTEFDVESGSFDTIVCFNCFPHFSDKLSALKNFHRLLVDGGRVIICHDQSRESINAVHAKHGLTDSSHFPDTKEMLGLMVDGDFQTEVFVDGEYYFVRAVKNRK